MAFWDNESRLVQHLCHSFVVSDDTGYSDRIFLDDEDSIEESDQGYHLNQRYKTGTNTVWLSHTHSVTKKELDETVKDMARDAKSRARKYEKVVKLVDNKENQATGEPIAFPKKPVANTQRHTSLLSEQLTNLSNTEVPYSQFAKFDARNSDDRRTLPVTIIFEETRKNLKVIARSDIRIFQLIGLSLYLYNEQKLEGLSPGNLENYKLYIADESGEIDKDFPALSENDFFHKFGFSHLGLVRVEKSRTAQPTEEEEVKDCVKIVYTHGKFPVNKLITMPRPSNQIQIIELLSLAIKRIGLVPSDVYILSEPEDTAPLAHTRLLSEFPKKEFWFSKQERPPEFEIITSNEYLDQACPFLEKFEVFWVNKKGEPMTHISLSKSQITIKALVADHKSSYKGKFKLHQSTLPKIHTLNKNSIQRCDYIQRAPNMKGYKVMFIMGVKSGEKKIYEFEADSQTCAKIISDLTISCPNLVKK